MFSVESATKKITLHRGDTGEVTFTADGDTFGSDDRALVTVKSSSGTEVYKHYFELDDGAFTLEFVNALDGTGEKFGTDHLQAGQYKYDVRYIKDPVWDSNEIVDGEVVSTPGSPFAIELLDTVGQV